MSFFIYILRSTNNELYIGQTNNLETREHQYLSKGIKAAKFIKDGSEFKLVYQEEYPTRILAMHRELQLKGWTRAKKEALIIGDKEKLKKLSKKGKVS